MIFIICDETTKDVIYQSTETAGLTPEFIAIGFYVDSVPEPQNQFGKDPKLKGDKVTSTVWYDYIDRPLTQEEEITTLKSQTETLQSALLEAQNAINSILGV